MLIQKDLEAKLIEKLSAALSAANVTGVEISGAWKTSQSGLVKWIENPSPSSAALVNVSVSCPEWETFTTPVVNFTAKFALFVRPEIDTTGDKLSSVASVIENLLRGWQTSTYQTSFTDLDLTNLSVDGVALQGGDSPVVENGVCVVAWSFRLSGSYRADSNN